MLYSYRVCCIFNVVLYLHYSIDHADAELWTEEDEAKRIQQLKEAERLEFQREQHLQTNQRYGVERPLPMQTFVSSYSEGVDAGRGQPSIHHHVRHSSKRVRLAAQNSGTEMFSDVNTESVRANWCYHCASPLNQVSQNMQRAIHKFLSLRRTAYPSDVIHTECTHPKNLSHLAKENCLHSHCQTLVLTDHDAGSAFTIRGCAERFGAINEKMLEARGDNTCNRLHETLDIQECICRHRKYCYAGAERSFFASNSQHLNGVPKFGFNTVIVAFIFQYLLL